MSQDYNMKMQFPTNDNFVARITTAEFIESKKSGNSMIHYIAEVVQPDLVDIGGKQVNIAGVEVHQYMVTHIWKGEGVLNDENTETSRERIRELWERMGSDPSQIDWENPDMSVLKGKVVLCAMGCGVEPQRKSPTPEQRAAHQLGDIMINPITKKELVYYKPKIVEIFGVAPGDIASGATANKPY